MAGTGTGLLAPGIEVVRVGLSGQADLVQAESLHDGEVVGQGYDVPNVGEIGRVGQVGATLPQLVVADDF